MQIVEAKHNIHVSETRTAKSRCPFIRGVRLWSQTACNYQRASILRLWLPSSASHLHGIYTLLCLTDSVLQRAEPQSSTWTQCIAK